MTTLVCRNNTGFDGESRSIAASIRAMAPYNFSWAVYVPKLKLVGNGIQDDSGYPKILGTIWQMKGNLPDSAGSPFHHPSKMDWNRGNEVIVSDASEEGKCPGLESFRELRQANVRMLYRSSVEKCQKGNEKKPLLSLHWGSWKNCAIANQYQTYKFVFQKMELMQA